MQRLEVSGAVRSIYGLLGVKRLMELSYDIFQLHSMLFLQSNLESRFFFLISAPFPRESDLVRVRFVT
jgi:hypothetical protein